MLAKKQGQGVAAFNLRSIARGLFCVAVLGALVGINLLFWQVDFVPEGAIEIVPSHYIAENVPVGESKTINIVLKNRTAFDLEVIGANSRCHDGICIQLASSLPLVVQSAANSQLKCTLAVATPGRFKTTLTLYLRISDQLQEKTIELSGCAI